MKHLIVLLFLFPALSFSQHLDRLLYQRYFERLFKYEPSLIREKNISSIVMREVETIGDTLVYNRTKDSIAFRKDGRPEQQRVWDPNYDYNYIMDFTYDSLDNLTLYNYWYLKTDGSGRITNATREVYVYDKKRLIKAYNYGPKTQEMIVQSQIEHFSNFRSSHDWNPVPMVLNTADSICYNPNQKQATIIHADFSKDDITYSDGEIPPVQRRLNGNKQTLWASSENYPNRPIDKKAAWETCGYNYRPALEKLSALTGVSCLPRELNYLYTKMKKTIENDELIEFVSDTSVKTEGIPNIGSQPFPFGCPDHLDARTFIRIDLKQQRVEFQTSEIFVAPTSMENEVTYTRVVYHYDFSMRLLWKDEYRANLGRNDFGTGKAEYKVSQTVYDYYEDGMLKREITFFEQKPYGYNPNDLYMKQVLYEITYRK